MSMPDTQAPTSNTLSNLIPRWKLVIALTLSGLMGAGAIGSIFDGQGLSVSMLGLGLALIPLLYLSHQRRKAFKDNSDTGAQISRNWLPVGIPIVAALMIGGSILQDSSNPSRDPDAVMVDAVGKVLTEAKDTLESLDLVVTTTDDTGDDRTVFNSGNWTVTSQSITAGDLLGDRSEVELGVVKTGEDKKSDSPESVAAQPLEQTEQESASDESAVASDPDVERQVADESFILYLDLNNIPYYGDRDAAIRAGRTTCNYIASGSSPELGVVVSIRTAQESGYTRQQAEQLVGSAVGAFCDRYLYALN